MTRLYFQPELRFRSLRNSKGAAQINANAQAPPTASASGSDASSGLVNTLQYKNPLPVPGLYLSSTFSVPVDPANPNLENHLTAISSSAPEDRTD